MDKFLGQTLQFWVELRMLADEKKLDANLLEEVIELRGKINFYESRIKQMSELIK